MGDGRKGGLRQARLLAVGALALTSKQISDQITVLKSLIATNIVTDVFIFILPIRSVWKLQMRKTEKIAVISCFALGAAYVSYPSCNNPPFPLSPACRTTSNNTLL